MTQEELEKFQLRELMKKLEKIDKQLTWMVERVEQQLAKVQEKAEKK